MNSKRFKYLMGGIPGAPANSPIGQAVMNTVLPGVGTAAAEMGKDELEITKCDGCGKPKQGECLDCKA